MCLCTRKESCDPMGRSSERAVAVAGDVRNPQQIPLSPVLSTFHCTYQFRTTSCTTWYGPSKQVEEGIELNMCMSPHHSSTSAPHSSFAWSGAQARYLCCRLATLYQYWKVVWWQAKEADGKAQGWNLTPRPLDSLHKAKQRLFVPR